MKKIEIIGLQTIPEIKQGDNLAQIIIGSANNEIGGLQEKDIIVLTSKIVSKAKGLMRKFSKVEPNKKALFISQKTGKDARWLQLIFEEGHEILAILPLKGIVEKHIMNASGEDEQCSRGLVEHEQAICITRSKEGRIHTCDAGIDGSNHQPDIVSLLPKDPDKAAKEIREQIQKLSGKTVAVILADTEMIPFGTMDLAVGSSGIEPRSKMFGKVDLFGKPKFGGMDLVAHELTSASALVFGQVNAGVPVAIIRGYEYKVSETENILNTLVPQGGKDGGVAEAIKATLRATSYTRGFVGRLLLKMACWFV
jgi:coenzyme F420-0:L-glutamate ligase/coenzyme F420-1:gamma-L-glutamate ligase